MWTKTQEGHSLVILPTYNEAENLVPLVEEILGMDHFHVLIVDDSSPDGTGEIALSLRRQFPGLVGVLLRPAKLGLGSAYVAGFRYALAGGYPFIFQMDADFSHNPADLIRLRSSLQAGADVAIGSRYIPGGGTQGWSPTRQFLSRIGSLYASLILGLPVRDLTGGFKGFRRRALEGLRPDSLRSNGFAFQIEVTYRCWQMGYHIEEVPIVFAERRAGKSKLSLAIIWEALWLPWRLRLGLMEGPRAFADRTIARR